MAKFTQKAIMLSMLELLEKKSIDKITVKDICEMCEINRNTFYYYFSDIYQVLEALFQYQADVVVKKNVEFESFYDELMYRYNLLFSKKKAVCHVYASKNKDIIEKYIERVTESFVEKYVIKADTENELDETDRKYIASFYSNAITGMTVSWLRDGLSDKKDDLVYRISTSFEATLQDMIKSCVKK